MRLLMFDAGAGRRLGVLAGDRVVDASEVAVDLLAAVQGGEGTLDALREKARRGAEGEGGGHALAEVRVLPPLDPPVGNVLAVGRNYQKHAEEGARVRGEAVAPPTIFTKAITTISGPHDQIPIDFSISEQIDWEVELGVVVSRGGANIARGSAGRHVFGYTVINDVSVRDVQNSWGGQFFKGKSFDYTCPCGPYVVTADEVADPQDLRLQLRVNGEVKQDASTRDMIYPVDAIIEWLSIGMTLLPGMLIATGTPEGVGFARNPPEFLRDGDLMESEISRIGQLRNRIVAASGISRLGPPTSLRSAAAG
jgi:2-keto-4-pentenoate hydratase/2-oxohepta-3-ene-1,7-dioic acid hydratase in catechol pathway